MITNYKLRNICIENNWYTNGDNEQYDKLFEMNDKKEDIGRLAVAIWICSCGVTYDEILDELINNIEKEG